MIYKTFLQFIFKKVNDSLYFMLLLRRVWHTFCHNLSLNIVPVTGKVGNEVLGNTGGGNVDFDGLLGVDLPVASMLLLLLLLLLLFPV